MGLKHFDCQPGRKEFHWPVDEQTLKETKMHGQLKYASPSRAATLQAPSTHFS